MGGRNPDKNMCARVWPVILIHDGFVRKIIWQNAPAPEASRGVTATPGCHTNLIGDGKPLFNKRGLTLLGPPTHVVPMDEIVFRGSTPVTWPINTEPATKTGSTSYNFSKLVSNLGFFGPLPPFDCEVIALNTRLALLEALPQVVC